MNVFIYAMAGVAAITAAWFSITKFLAHRQEKVVEELWLKIDDVVVDLEIAHATCFITQNSGEPFRAIAADVAPSWSNFHSNTAQIAAYCYDCFGMRPSSLKHLWGYQIPYGLFLKFAKTVVARVMVRNAQSNAADWERLIDAYTQLPEQRRCSVFVMNLRKLVWNYHASSASKMMLSHLFEDIVSECSDGRYGRLYMSEVPKQAPAALHAVCGAYGIQIDCCGKISFKEGYEDVLVDIMDFLRMLDFLTYINYLVTNTTNEATPLFDRVNQILIEHQIPRLMEFPQCTNG